MAISLKRPERTLREEQNQKGKMGAPWKRSTRDAQNEDISSAYSDIRLEERFFLGNTTGGLRSAYYNAPREMNAYQPTAAEKQNGTAPKAFGQIENTFGRVELGLDEKKEQFTLAIGQKMDADRNTLPNYQRTLRGANATPVRGMVGERGNVLASTFQPEQSALLVKTKANRGYRDALSLLTELKARGGSEAIEEVLPFLSTDEERTEENRLEQTLSQLPPERRQAAQLRLGHVRRIRLLKEQRRYEFLQRMNILLQRARNHPTGQEPQRAPSLLDRILTRLLRANSDGAAPQDIPSLISQLLSGGASPKQMVSRLLDRLGDQLSTDASEWEALLSSQNPQRDDQNQLDTDGQQQEESADTGDFLLQMILAEILSQIGERLAQQKAQADTPPVDPPPANTPPTDTPPSNTPPQKEE